MRYYQSLVFRWLDTFAHPPGVPEWPERLPEPVERLVQSISSVGLGQLRPEHRDQQVAPLRSSARRETEVGEQSDALRLGDDRLHSIAIRPAYIDIAENAKHVHGTALRQRLAPGKPFVRTL